jgi:NIF3 (NGG1p interacting factor 3)
MIAYSLDCFKLHTSLLTNISTNGTPDQTQSRTGCPPLRPCKICGGKSYELGNTTTRILDHLTFFFSLMLRRLFSTSVVKMEQLPPLTKLVQQSMQKLYPLALADRSWDNVGLLLEPPFPRPRKDPARPTVLLTVDLTTAVAKEALEPSSGVETIVTYRIHACRF